MKDFLPYELAVKLKEKGFKEPCTHFYRNGTFRPQEMFCGLRSNTHHKWSFNSMEVKLKDTHERIQVNIVDAPTISQVLKWLREEKDLFVQIMFVDKFSYYYEVIDISTAQVKCSSGDYKESPELAALAGIEYCLDNLI